ncbi:hypothetical protein [Deinococcus aquiradiocola]|uniref:Tetratricopeptide repeat protein n=1 Tax=Deinococcus aquiradiocola TaxID=393059 RepID=A0A917PL39_9DEIO|nr:hypothetical protein [Deinococcus aquiradiocola]GGJ82879.1 hypothetical protein GCM10008939_28520 [Deinococcus aquiradiocola]
MTRPAPRRARRPLAAFRGGLAALAATLGLLGAGLAGADAALDARTLTYQNDDGLTTWTRTYPPELGPISGPLRQDGLTWLAVGPALYGYADDGEQRVRLDFPGEVSALDGGGGTLQATAGFGSVRQTFTVAEMQIQGRVVLPPDPQVTGWLARAASVVPQSQLVQASQQDPANPFLNLRLARLSELRGDRYGAISAAQRAVTAEVPFAASVQLAAQLDAAGYPAAADLSLDRAASDWAARGYDPALTVSQDALRAYGDPLGELNTLLAQNKLRRAEAWIRYLRLVSPRFQGYPELYARYARILDAQDRGGEADEWRQFSHDLSAGTLYNLGPGSLLILQAASRLLAAALLLAILAALSGYAVHYWRVQGEDLAPLGGRWRSWLRHPLSRARRITLGYAGFGEKLVLVALLLGLLISLSAWVWTGRVNARLLSPALTAGTYGGAWFYDGLDRLALSGNAADIALIRGLASQLDGDTATARQTYARAGTAPSACIQNNLGVLSGVGGDTAQARDSYRQALALDPGQVPASYNLGLHPQSPETAFQESQRSNQPRLCYPDQQTLIQALDTPPGSSVLGLLRDPWNVLNGLPTGLPRPLQWMWVTLLLALLTASILWLAVPRLPAGHAAGRPPLYRLTALLLPGSALLEGAWGSVLLLGWALTLAVLAGRRGLIPSGALLGSAGAGLGAFLVTLLAAIYALNILVFVLEELRSARDARRSRRS